MTAFTFRRLNTPSPRLRGEGGGKVPVRDWTAAQLEFRLPLTRKPRCTRLPTSPRKRGEVISGTVAGLAMVILSTAPPAAADEEPKRGGILTYMIPADAPPSFDAHREETYATIHSAAPFYSVLIRANPYDPGKTDDLVCDLCAAMPKPTDDGKTYTFKIREGVKFTDGSPLAAEDVAASWNEIIFPPNGVISARQ